MLQAVSAHSPSSSSFYAITTSHYGVNAPAVLSAGMMFSHPTLWSWKQVSVRIPVGGQLHALCEWAADVIDVERHGEVSDVHIGVGEHAREDEIVL